MIWARGTVDSEVSEWTGERTEDIRYCSRESVEEKVWVQKERGVFNNTLKAEKVCGVEKHVWACVIPSSLSLSSLLLCLSASICWNSTAIARRLLDITGCPAPLLLIPIHTCPLSPEGKHARNGPDLSPLALSGPLVCPYWVLWLYIFLYCVII